MNTVTDPAMTRVHRMAAWGSLAMDFSDGHCTIVPGGDTRCDPLRPTVNPYAEERARAESRIGHDLVMEYDAARLITPAPTRFDQAAFVAAVQRFREGWA